MKIEDVKNSLEKGLPGIALKTVRDSLLIENTDDLPKVVEFLKNSDEFKMDYLSSVTASDFVDYLESLYHLYSMEKKIGPITLRVRVKPDKPKVPSLVPIYRGAEFQERDNYDLFGIEYVGHPDLRRIMMWEGFDGFPMRKNYKQEDSETLDAEDIKWLEKHQVQVSEELKNKALNPKVESNEAENKEGQS